jgi:hypothetical protein
MTSQHRVLEPGRLARAKRAFTTRRVALERGRLLIEAGTRPMPGDLVLARVEAVGAHKQLQLHTGRAATLFPGDEVLLAAGARYAPDQFEAYVAEALGACDLVAAGGICGTVVARSDRMAEPTRLTALGLVADATGRILNLADFRLHPPPATRRVPTLAVLGTSMNAGKTTAAAHLVRGLALSGLRVGAAKVTGTGAPGDLNLMTDAGAACVLDFTDAGHATTFLVDQPALEEILRALGDALIAAGAQAIVLEVADGLYQRETAALAGSPTFATRVDTTLFAAGDAMGAANGVRELVTRGLPVAAVTGLLTRSPLARREAQAATGLPVLAPAELAAAGMLDRLLSGPALLESAA